MRKSTTIFINNDLPEGWTPIPNFERLYCINENGEILGLVSGKILRPATNRSGYLWVALSKNNKQHHLLVHRIIAITFIPNPDNKPYVNHIDGNKTNNSISNLEWCTAKENVIHAVNVTKAHSSVKCNPKNPVHIIEFDKQGNQLAVYSSINACAKEKNIDRSTVTRLLKGAPTKTKLNSLLKTA